VPPPDATSNRLNIRARRALVGDRLVDDVVIVVRDGLIVAIEPDGDRYRGDPVHDLVSPGLVDLQCNGFEDVSVLGSTAEEIVTLRRALARAGTTAFLPTITSSPLSVMAETVGAVADANTDQPDHGGVILGVHFEGPFLGRRPGAHDSRVIEHSVRHVEAIIEMFDRHARLVTLAAESPAVGPVTTRLRRRNIPFLVGHSEPTRTEYDQLVATGLRGCTHLFNAMSGVDHRSFGLAGAILDDPTMYAGLIGDLVHVDAETIRLVHRVKGPNRTFLVSDSVGRRGLVVSDAGRLPDGRLAGSVVPLAGAVRNLVTRVGVPLVDALISATATPCCLIGDDTRGRLEAGLRADLTCFDAGLAVERVYVAGVPQA